MEKLGDPLNRILHRLGLDWLEVREAVLQETRNFLEHRGLARGVNLGFRQGVVYLQARSGPLRQELSLLQGALLEHLQQRWGDQVRDVKILRGRKR